MSSLWGLEKPAGHRRAGAFLRPAKAFRPAPPYRGGTAAQLCTRLQRRYRAPPCFRICGFAQLDHEDGPALRRHLEDLRRDRALSDPDGAAVLPRLRFPDRLSPADDIRFNKGFAAGDPLRHRPPPLQVSS